MGCTDQTLFFMTANMYFMCADFFVGNTLRFIVVVVVEYAKGRKCNGKNPQQQYRQYPMNM